MQIIKHSFYANDDGQVFVTNDAGLPRMIDRHGPLNLLNLVYDDSMTIRAIRTCMWFGGFPKSWKTSEVDVVEAEAKYE